MKKRTKVNALAFGTVLVWASAFPLTKIAMTHYAPISLGFLRCSIAAIALLLIGRVNHIGLPREKKDVLWFFLSGAMGFSFYMITFNTGIQTLTSATSSIVIALTPIITAVAVTRFFDEKIKGLGWVGIFSAFVGVVVLLLWDGIFSVNIGLLWTLAATLVFTVYNLLTKMLAAKGYTALEIVAYSMFCGAVLLLFCLPSAAVELKTADFRQILILIYLGVMPSALAYFLWGTALTIADRTSEVTNYMFVTPLLSALLGFILLGEIPNGGTLVGGAIIIAGIVLFNRKGQ